MSKLPYHPKAIAKGRPIFGPTDVGTGGFQAWLEARKREGDPDAEAFAAELAKLQPTTPESASAQRARMLETFEFPPAVARALEEVA